MRILRSVLRITIAVLVVLAIAFAALLVVVRQPTFRALPYRASVRADENRLRAHVEFLTRDVAPRDARHPRNLARAAEYIATHFRAAGGTTALQWFDARGERYANVIGQWGPDDPSKPVLVVGAHYDAFSARAALPGADDNASGTAGLLELARLLQTQKLDAPVLLVAFVNEEPPFFGSEEMGSAVHASTLAASRRRVRGMICLEMIGYYGDTQTWPNGLFRLMYPTTGDFIGVGGGWEDRHLARHVKRAIRGAGGIDVVSFTGPRATTDAS
ncbi:MAG TPA: M28 family peptidase, partial [Thermoanaerobaculia bacterium]|nr:M28 family peptidase [Thermoanaerobaculia bacterium]